MANVNATLERFRKVQEGVAAACAKGKRGVGEVTLVAVTKNAAPEQMKPLIEAGHRDFGESKVQLLQQHVAQMEEWLNRSAQHTEIKGPGKGAALPGAVDLRWHMVGHLQRNKVKPVLQLCKYVHSVDSLRLAEEIQLNATKLDRPVHIFLEVNTTGEGSKFGVAVGAALHLAEQIDTMEEVKIVGLMTMAPFSSNPEDARPAFVRLREIFEEIKFKKIGGALFQHLSMGMSGDYQVAIEEGATMVRVGTAIFGAGAA